MRVQTLFRFLFFLIVASSSSVSGQVRQSIIAVPKVVGMNFKNAKKLLQDRNLRVGAVVYDTEFGNFDNHTKDLDTLIVYKQVPPNKKNKWVQNFVQKGESVDLWLATLQMFNDTSKAVDRGYEVFIQ